MKSIGLRIRELREHKKLTQKEFCELVEIKQSNLSHIENKGEKISIEVISRIISNFNIDANWLILGRGEMFYKKEDQSNKDNSIISQYLEDKEKMVKMLEKEVNRLEQENMFLKEKKETGGIISITNVELEKEFSIAADKKVKYNKKQ